METPEDYTSEPESMNADFLVIDRPWDHGIYQSSNMSKIVCFNAIALNKSVPAVIRIDGIDHFGGEPAHVTHWSDDAEMQAASPLREYHRKPKAKVHALKK